MRIAIIGCGPGGLASAILLKRAGHDVVLFDQFERPKPLGSGLLIQPSGQAVLTKLGLFENAIALSAPVTRLSGVDIATGRRALDMEYRHLGPGVSALGIHRANLFQLLFEAAAVAQIEIRPGRKMNGAIERSDGIVALFENGAPSDSFDLLVDAAGANSPLAQGKTSILPFAALWTTVDLPNDTEIAEGALDQRYVGAHKMAGIMPVGLNPATGKPGAALFWSIKPSDYQVVRDCGIAKWREDYLSVWPEAEPFVQQVSSFDDLTLAIYCHRTGSPRTTTRIFHIGDSWHCTSPQLGQGANMALLDATALVDAVRHGSSIEEIGRRYRHLRADHVSLYQALSFVFTPLYQSDSALLPWIRNLAIHNSARAPLVRRLIAEVVAGNLGNFGR